MGEVFAVRDRQRDEVVALKTLRHFDPAHFGSLKAEFRATSELHHPGLVRLFELDVVGREAWFTMELVEGGPLHEQVREGRAVRAPLDPTGIERLCRLGLRLVDAVAVLHRAGVLHRDLKPDNVFVTPQHRVVLLDFGLATARRSDGGGPERPSVAGTLPYMAPEAIDGLGDEAADRYALGVMLYECLVGENPFPGGVVEVYQRKRERAPILASEAVEGVPPDLDQLIAALLNPDPAERPRLTRMREVLATYARRETESDVVFDPSGLEVALVDRVDERARCRAAWDQVRQGRSRVLRLSGPSGIGKSALVRAVLDDIAVSGPVMALRGRCRPNESVPFKALDEVVDQLAQHLWRLDEVTLASVLPRHLDTLIRLFPVLSGLRQAPGGRRRAEPGAVLPLRSISGSRSQSVSWGLREEDRQRGIQALRELLARLGDVRDVVVWIDDFQWADMDSVVVLTQLLAPPDPPRLLLVLSHREEEERLVPLAALDSGPLARILAPLIDHVQVGPLDMASVGELYETITGEALSGELQASLMGESEGSPLFVENLARSGLREWLGGAGGGGRELVRRRLDGLSQEGLRLMTVCSLAVSPLPVDIALEAAEATSPSRELISGLCAMRLLRESPSAGGVRILPYHDRIGEVAQQLVAPGERSRLHAGIARALERHGDVASPEALLHHVVEGGEVERAADYALLAAERAENQLAFHRAAERYRQILDEGWQSDTTQIRRRLASALANAGLGAEAAPLFEGLARDPSTKSFDRRVLLRLAAEQYLKAGRLEEGSRVLQEVLALHGVPQPRSTRSALLSALRHRACFLVRGIRHQPVEAGRCDPDQVERVDALWTAATSYAVVNHIFADAMAARHLMEALALGEPSRVVRALGYETCAEAILPGAFFQRRAAWLGQEAIALAERAATPQDRAFAVASVGTLHWARGEWEDSVRCCDEAVAVFLDVGAGVAWSLALNRMYLFAGLAWQGAMVRLVPEVDAALQDARTRRDRFQEAVCLLGQPALAWIADGRAAWALEEADRCIESWGRDRFLTQHYHHVLATSRGLVAEGRPAEAWTRVEEAWPHLKSGMFLNIEVVRAEMWHLRGLVAFAAWAAEGSVAGDERWSREVRLARREVGRTSVAPSEGATAQLDGALARMAGDEAGEKAAMARAAEAFEARGMRLWAWACGIQAGHDRATPEGVADPERLAKALGVVGGARSA